MNDVVALSLALMAGVLIGTLFFGGLWWTVQKGLTSNHPALWFLTSTLLRMSFAVTGFYFIAHGDWQKLLVCLVGFFIARIVVTRLTRNFKEGNHAS
jgi:F1F0 ATPase subunit 2